MVLWLAGAGLSIDAGEPYSPPISKERLAEIAAEISAHHTTADDLWGYIEKWNHVDGVALREQNYHLRPACEEFCRRFPQDPRRWDALLAKLDFEGFKQSFIDECMQVAKAPDAAAAAKEKAREILRTYLGFGYVDVRDELLEKDFSDYEKDFPDDPIGAEFVQKRISHILCFSPEELLPRLQALTQSPNTATAEAARNEIAKRSKPLDLKLTSISGKIIDLSKMRSQVVLLYFWATWGAPRRNVLPEIFDLQKRYHGQDFKIVGINMDEDKNALKKAIKSRGMDWILCNDKADAQDEVIKQFNVNDSQIVVLLDRTGVAHRLNDGADLDAHVKALLAERL